LMANDTPEVAAAKLCCAVDCPTNGSTSSKVAPLRVPASVRAPSFLVSVRPWTTAGGLFWRSEYVHGPPGSPPTYLLNLAFLI
jgi:hypothetical protein